MGYRGTILKITQDQNDYAKIVSSQMSNPMIRKKGLIDILGITGAVNYFLASKIKVNVQRSLHKVPRLLEEFKITDIYYNNYRMDVITVFREKKIKIPRLHVDLDILPHFYLIVQIGSMLKETRVIGYLNATDILDSRNDSRYYYPKEEKIKDIEDLKRIIKIPAPVAPVIGKHLDCMSLFLRFIDGELSTSYKKMFAQHLLSCETCASKLIDVIEFDNAAKSVRSYPKTIEKYHSKIMASRKHMPLGAGMYPSLPNSFDDKLKTPKPLPSVNEALEHLQNEQEKERIALSNTTKRNAIELIFKDKPDFEGSSMESILPPVNKKKLIAIGVWAIIAIGICTFAFTRHSQNTPTPITDADASEYAQDSGLPEAGQENLTASQNAIPKDFYEPSQFDKEPDYSLASEANGEPIIATINKISWEVPENIADKASYKKFLQLVGKNIKLNLQNDLLLSNDTAKNSVIKVDIKFSHNGDIQNLKISQTSGSSQIDNIIKKSVTETLSYMKPPQSGFITKSVEITLVINL